MIISTSSHFIYVEFEHHACHWCSNSLFIGDQPKPVQGYDFSVYVYKTPFYHMYTWIVQTMFLGGSNWTPKVTPKMYKPNDTLILVDIWTWKGWRIYSIPELQNNNEEVQRSITDKWWTRCSNKITSCSQSITRQSKLINKFPFFNKGTSLTRKQARIPFTPWAVQVWYAMISSCRRYCSCPAKVPVCSSYIRLTPAACVPSSPRILYV